ncbi:hypothetical protein [Actinosynnema sp. NPDC020468]|uniref:hypothetical protein n=1 Tax=Actinosynnema sp. NPDC020468 TaxID=3154488 RepID=UPI0033CDFF47
MTTLLEAGRSAVVADGPAPAVVRAALRACSARLPLLVLSCPDPDPAGLAAVAGAFGELDEAGVLVVALRRLGSAGAVASLADVVLAEPGVRGPADLVAPVAELADAAQWLLGVGDAGLPTAPEPGGFVPLRGAGGGGVDWRHGVPVITVDTRALYRADAAGPLRLAAKLALPVVITGDPTVPTARRDPSEGLGLPTGPYFGVRARQPGTGDAPGVTGGREVPPAGSTRSLDTWGWHARGRPGSGVLGPREVPIPAQPGSRGESDAAAFAVFAGNLRRVAGLAVPVVATGRDRWIGAVVDEVVTAADVSVAVRGLSLVPPVSLVAARRARSRRF